MIVTANHVQIRIYPAQYGLFQLLRKHLCMQLLQLQRACENDDNSRLCSDLPGPRWLPGLLAEISTTCFGKHERTCTDVGGLR